MDFLSGNCHVWTHINSYHSWYPLLKSSTKYSPHQWSTIQLCFEPNFYQVCFMLPNSCTEKTWWRWCLYTLSVPLKIIHLCYVFFSLSKLKKTGWLNIFSHRSNIQLLIILIALLEIFHFFCLCFEDTRTTYINQYMSDLWIYTEM